MNRKRRDGAPAVDIENGTSMRTRYFVHEGNVSAAVLGSRSILISTGIGREAGIGRCRDNTKGPQYNDVWGTKHNALVQVIPYQSSI